MRIETKDDWVTCPADNWERIPTINCTGAQTSPKCQYFNRRGGKEGTDILCNHPPPGGEITTTRQIHKKSDGLKIDCPRFITGEASLNFCIQECNKNRGYTFSHVTCAHINERDYYEPKEGTDEAQPEEKVHQRSV